MTNQEVSKRLEKELGIKVIADERKSTDESLSKSYHNFELLKIGYSFIGTTNPDGFPDTIFAKTEKEAVEAIFECIKMEIKRLFRFERIKNKSLIILEDKCLAVCD